MNSWWSERRLCGFDSSALPYYPKPQLSVPLSVKGGAVPMRTCAARRRTPLGKGGRIAVIGLALVACGDADTNNACVPNETRPCFTGSAQGVQVCSFQRSWGSCDTGAPTGMGTGGTSDGTSGAGGSSTPPPPRPDPSTQSCFMGGDVASVGCGELDIRCCTGSLCVDFGGVTACAATCSAVTDCASGCCATLSDASASICSAADTCQTPLPDDLRPAPLPDSAVTYELSNIDRVGSNLYKAVSGSTQLLIETRLCLALTLRDDGLLVESDTGTTQLYIDNSSGDVCDVATVYAAAPPFGTYELIGIQNEATDIYRAQSGLVDVIVETQLCFAYPGFANGVLVWEFVGAQLLIDDFSETACDVVNVYTE